MAHPFVLPFDEITPEQLSLVGGKGLNLGRLARAGLPVPPGFVITTAAYREPNDPAVEPAILSAYRQLGGLVAVRSSATAEDLEGASFAGQQETFLGIEGEETLLQAVRDCWRSLFTARAVAYRRQQGIGDDAISMAVVVQRLVNAEAAGVLFTRDPTDPAGTRMLVEGSWGLGEAVVSGRVTPDRWTLQRETGQVLSKAISTKPVQVTARGEEIVPADLQSQPCLAPGDLRALHALAQQIEALYGTPQDVEWGTDRGQVWLLQSRPITVATGDRNAARDEEIARLRTLAEQTGTVWARYSLAEVLPEPLPMTWAIIRGWMSGKGGYGQMYRNLGFDPDPALDELGVLDLVCGRPYFNLSRDARLYFRHFPNDYPFAKLKANPALAIYPKPEPNLAKAPPGFWWRLPFTIGRMMAVERQLKVTAANFEASFRSKALVKFAHEARAAAGEELGHLMPHQLVARTHDWIERCFYKFGREALIPSVLAAWALDNLERGLVQELGETQGRDAARRLVAGVAPDPEADTARDMRAAARAELTSEEFLTRHGHRGDGEMELAEPRWREQSEGVRARIDALCGLPPERPEPLAQLEDVLVKPTRQAETLKRHLDTARRYLSLRETAKHALMQGYAEIRRTLVELDQRFELHGGIFYLEPRELERLANGEDLRPLISVRRRRRAVLLGIPVPRVLFSDDLDAIGRVEPVPNADSQAGTAVSPGVAEGPALVLRHPNDAPPDATGYILVCPSTDPGWMHLFPRARGLVLETGGLLSHGAIVAREFGLPAVANVPSACDRYHTGQRLRVDGVEGTVVAS